MHALQISEIAAIVCSFAVPIEPPKDTRQIPKPEYNQEALQKFAGVCSVWHRVAALRKKFFVDLASTTLLTVNNLPGNAYSDFHEDLTLNQLVERDWICTNLSTVRLLLQDIGPNRDVTPYVERMIIPLSRLRILHLDTWEDMPNVLELNISQMMQSARLQKLWLEGFDLALDIRSSASLHSLTLKRCQLRSDIFFTNLVYRSLESLRHLHLEELEGNGCLTVKTTLPSLLRNLEALIVENILMDQAFQANSLHECRSLKFLYLEDRLPLDQNMLDIWPHIQIIIVKHARDGQTEFVKAALRQDYPQVSYIVAHSRCYACDNGHGPYSLLDWVPQETHTLRIYCRDCSEDPLTVFSFYELPFPRNCVPANYTGLVTEAS